MKKISLLIFYSLLSIAIFAQQDDAQKYASTITGQDLKKHLTIIAGADMEGRETATEGQRKAAAYIESQFKQLGLKPPPGQNGYQQVYPLFKDTMLTTSLKIGKTKYEFGKDYLVTPNSALNQEIKSKEIVFVGYGIDDKAYDDYGSKDVKGKIVVFFSGEPKSSGKYLISGTARSSRWSNNIQQSNISKTKRRCGSFY